VQPILVQDLWGQSKIQNPKSKIPMTDISPIQFLGTAAFGMLLLVTVGVGYLTVAGWRDRQRREEDARSRRMRR
jgi:hypothetical protein